MPQNGKMEFYCRVGSASGEVLDGVYSADDEAKLRRELEEKGYCLLSLRRRSRLGLAGLTWPGRHRIKTREFIVFNQELAALLRAGMPLVQSLDILRQRVESEELRAVVDDVYERVRGGASLSDAFEAQTNRLPGVYTASLMAGERSGSLEEVLCRYVTYARVLAAVRRKTISALIYPAILLGLSLVVVGIIVLQVVPVFGEFYEGLGADLPSVTRAIMAVSQLLRQSLALLLLAGSLIGAVLWLWYKRADRRASLDRLLLTVPGIGAIARKFSTSQLARTLATLLGGGIPLVSALDVSSRALGNRYFAHQLDIVTREVREGQALSTSLAKRGIFPAVAIKMVEVGESTGALQEMLTNIGDFFDEEIETALGRFMTVIEPLLLVIMGVLIAGLLLALYMPLIQLGSLVS